MAASSARPWTRYSLRTARPRRGRSSTTTAAPASCLWTRRQRDDGTSVPLRFGEEIWELPAGKLEADEDPFEAAKRELSEECGLTADNFIDLGVVYATVGYDSEKIYLWAATGLHSTAQHLDAGEFLDVVKMPFDEALGLVMDGTIKDSKTQVALLKYAQLRAKV